MSVFRSRFDGTCKTCSGKVKKGQFITWNRSEKGIVRHVDCKDPDRQPTTEAEQRLDNKIAQLQTMMDEVSKKIEGSPASIKASEDEGEDKGPLHDKLEESVKKVVAAKARIAPTQTSAQWWDLLEAIIKWANEEQQYIRVLLLGPSGTGKSTTCAKLAGITPENRITFTRGMGVEDAIGMYQLIGGETVFVPTKISAAMEKGERMLWDEIDHHAEEIGSGMYGWLDDSPHVTLPTGATLMAKQGYGVFATTNSNVTALPDAILDRFDVILPAIMPHPDAVAQFKSAARRDAVNNYFRALDITPWKWAGKATLRRMRSFEMLEPIVGEVNAAELAFGSAGKEQLGVLTTAAREPKYEHVWSLRETADWVRDTAYPMKDTGVQGIPLDAKCGCCSCAFGRHNGDVPYNCPHDEGGFDKLARFRPWNRHDDWLTKLSATTGGTIEHEPATTAKLA